MDAERVVTALFEAGSRKARNHPLIEVISEPPAEAPAADTLANLPPTGDTDCVKDHAGASESTGDRAEEPSLLELMIAAQAAAKRERDKQTAACPKKSSAGGLGAGFKKGFLAQPSKASKSQSRTDTKSSENVPVGQNFIHYLPIRG